MVLRVVSEKHPRQDKNCFSTAIPGQRVRGVGLREGRSWRRDRMGAGPHPGGYSFP